MQLLNKLSEILDKFVCLVFLKKQLFQRLFLTVNQFQISITSNKGVSSGEVVCRCSSKQVFLKISQISQENTSAGVFLINCRPQVCKFIKTSLQHRRFPVKFVKLLLHLFSQNISGGYFWCFGNFANFQKDVFYESLPRFLLRETTGNIS